MTGLHKALTSWLSALSLPVYPAGQVPEGSPLPYLTCTLRQPDFGCGGALTLSGYFRDTSAVSAAAARAAFLDGAQALIPAGGALIRYAGGVATLVRDGDFLSCAVSPADPELLVGTVRATLRCYE